MTLCHFFLALLNDRQFPLSRDDVIGDLRSVSLAARRLPTHVHACVRTSMLLFSCIMSVTSTL